MYKNTQKHEEEKYQTEKHIIKYHSLHNNGNYFTPHVQIFSRIFMNK